MPIFPRIDGPCPYKDRLSAIMDGDFCRMCQRTVHDLTAMDDHERASFLATCETKVCVSYRVSRAALGVAAVAAAAVALPAAAQDAPPVVPLAATEEIYIVVGGIDKAKHSARGEQSIDAAIPDLPVIVETAAATVPAVKS